MTIAIHSPSKTRVGRRTAKLPKMWDQLRPHATQRRLWTSPHRIVKVTAGRISGKTTLARRRIVSKLPVKMPWPDPRYFYALPTYGWARRVAWEQLLNLVPAHWLDGKPSESEMLIRTVFGSKLYVVGLDVPSRVEGSEWDGCVIDECSDQRPGVYTKSIAPALSSRKGWCFPPGTQVRMADGTEKPIEQVQIGDEVVRASGTIGRVEQVHQRQYDGELLSVNLFGHKALRCTPNHSFPTQRGDVAAEGLTESDALFFPKYMPCEVGRECSVLQTAEHVPSKTPRVYYSGKNHSARKLTTAKQQVPDLISLDYSTGRIFGLYLAEGCGDAVVYWCFNADEENTLVAELIALLKSEWNADAVIKRHTYNNGLTVQLNSRQYAELFHSLCGKYSHSKRVHGDLLSAPREFLEGLLSGWLDGDGSLSWHHGRLRQRASSCSKSLAMTMYDIAHWLGKSPAFARHTTERRPKFLVQWLEGEATRKTPWKTEEPNRTQRRIREIKRQAYSGPVYNIGIAGEHTYVADGVATNNCWRIGAPKRYGPGGSEFRAAFQDGLLDGSSYTWPSWDIIDAEENARLKREMDPKDYAEQIGGNFQDSGGQAYYSFSKKLNVSACNWQADQMMYVFSDFNVDPMAWCLAHIGETKNKLGETVSSLHVWDEIWLRDTNTQKTLDFLWEKYGKNHKGGFTFVGDPAAKQRRTSATSTDYRMILNDQRFNARTRYDKQAPAVKDRLTAVNRILCDAEGSVRCWIDPRCKHLIDDLENRAINPDGTPCEARPGKVHDSGHMSDALGYGVWKYFPIVVEERLRGEGLIVFGD